MSTITSSAKRRHAKMIDFSVDDVMLFDSARNGDKQAYGALFEKHIDSIIMWHKNDTRLEFQDLRQEVYSRTYSQVQRIPNLRAWRSFCITCAKNILRDAAKKNTPILYNDSANTKTRIDNLADPRRSSSPEFNLMNEEIKQILLDEIKELSADDQRIFFLFFIDELPIKSISEEMNMPWSTVNDRVNAIRAKLSKSKPLRSLYLNGACPFILQSIFEYGNVGTQGVGAASSKGILSVLSNGLKWFLSLIGLIFTAMLWLTSCMVLGTKGMAEFGRSTQGTSLRVLFIKLCTIGYALVVLLPIFAFEIDFYLLSNICSEGWLRTHGMDIILVLWTVTLSSFMLYARFRFARGFNNNINSLSTVCEMNSIKKSLRVRVNIMCWFIACGIVFFCFHCLLGIHEYPHNTIPFLFKHNWPDLLLGLALYLGYHLFSWHVFLQFVANIDHELSPEVCSNGRRYGICLLTAAGVVFTLFIPSMGLLLGSQKIVSIIFMAFFILAWLLLIIWNRKRQLIFPIFLLTAALFIFLQVISDLLGWR